MPDTCLAYIDPGTGSILLQVLLGGLVGIGLFFRRAIFRVGRILIRGGEAATREAAQPANKSLSE